MLVVFFARASGQSNTKNFQHMFTNSTGKWGLAVFFLERGEEEGHGHDEEFSMLQQVRSWAVFNLCTWTLKWTFIPATELSLPVELH